MALQECEDPPSVKVHVKEQFMDLTPGPAFGQCSIGSEQTPWAQEMINLAKQLVDSLSVNKCTRTDNLPQTQFNTRTQHQANHDKHAIVCYYCDKFVT